MSKTTTLKSVHAIAFLLALLFSTASTAAAQTILDGGTPVGVAPGAPAGSYPLSNLDNVNLFSGNLNFALPLLKVTGRGGAQHTMTLPIESHWTNWYFFQQPTGALYNPIPMYNMDVFTGLKPGYGPGILIIRNSKVEEGVGCPGTVVDTQLRLNFVASDGTQFELRDTIYDGAPISRMCFAPVPSRGTTFVSKDGSATTFVSDTSISDGFMPERGVYGYLSLANGLRYRIDNGLVSWMRDPNGNQITYTYTNDRVTSIQDSLGRTVIIEYAVNDGIPYGLCDRIKFKASGGQERIIRVSYGLLSTALASGHTLLTKNQMFPPQFGPDVVSEMPGMNTNFDTNVVTSVWLPDDGVNRRRYQFFYNGFGELARAVLPTGGAFEYVWETTPLTEYEEGYQQEIHRRIKTRKVFNGTAAEQRTEYSYSLPATRSGSTIVTVDHYHDSQPAQALSQEKHFFHGTPIPVPFTPLQSTVFRDSPWTTGKEYQSDQLGPAGTPLLRSVARTWRQRASVSWCTGVQCTQDTAPVNDPRIVESTTTLDTGQVSKRTSIDPSDQSGQTVGFDQFNNPTDVWEYDFGPTSPGAFLRRTHIDYVTATNYVNYNVNPAAGAHIRGLVSQQWISSDSAGANKVSVTQYEYDNYANDARHKPLVARPGITGLCLNKNTQGTCITSSDANFQIRGNVTNVTSYAIASTLTNPVSASTQYDVAGNPVARLDGLAKTTTFSYADSFCNGSTCGGTFTPNTFAFATGTTSPIPDPTGEQGSDVALVSSSVLDFWTGRATSSTDVNNQTTGFEYNDVIDRLKAIIRPAGGGRTDFEYGDIPGDLFVRTLTDLDSSRKIDSYQYFDGLGRATETRLYEGGINYISRKQEYDGLGRVSKTSNPYRQSETPEWTITAYDGVNRVISVTFPGNAQVGTAYSGNQVLVTDQSSKQRLSKVDALGRTTDVWEIRNADSATVAVSFPGHPEVTAGYRTTYGYDVLENLVSVTQRVGAAGTVQTRSFAYDSLKRLTSATNPESGSISYQYDANSNLTHKTDAKVPAMTTTYVYDALNRITDRTYSDSTPSAAYAYDAAGVTNSKGRLTSLSSSVSSYSYNAYDAVGNVQSCTQTTDGQSYVIGYEYDLAGNVKSVAYPSGRVVATEFDSTGRIAGIRNQGTGNYYAGAAAAGANRIQYSAAGQISSMKLGNGLWEHTNFNSRLQPIQIGLGSAMTNSSVLQLDYDYGTTTNNGNVLSQTITHSGLTLSQSYGYDQLNRLETASENGGASWKQKFLYDRYGNRRIDPSSANTSSDLVGPNPNFSQANNRINPQSGELYQYDGVGNLTRGRNGETYGFDAENKMKSFNGGASQGGADYSYDADGKRVKKVVGTVSTVFVYDVSGRLIAEYTNAAPASNGTRYLTGDYQGSPRVVTDSSGVVKARHDYHPFGEEVGLRGGRTEPNGYVADNVRQKFTAKERDNETGLDYFMARYYSSLQGRFTSPDDFLNDTRPGDPASWNLYTYARNNPLNLLDPTGEEVTGDGLTEKERQKIINDWKRKTGYVDIHFDANNKLVINREAGIAVGPDGKRLGSADARANLTDLIETKTVFNLESANGSNEVAFASVDAGTVTINNKTGSRSLSYTVKIDFDDFKEQTGDPEAIAAHSVGLAVLHETDHKLYGEITDYPNGRNNPGPVETNYINPIREQLGLATRQTYEARPVSGMGNAYRGYVEVRFRLNGTDRMLRWRDSAVGGVHR